MQQNIEQLTFAQILAHINLFHSLQCYNLRFKETCLDFLRSNEQTRAVQNQTSVGCTSLTWRHLVASDLS